MARSSILITGLILYLAITQSAIARNHSIATTATLDTPVEETLTLEQLESEWRSWLEAERERYASFRADVEQRWGDFVTSTRSRWVQYSPSLDMRSIIDFESGSVTVEILTTVAVPDSHGEARRRLGTELQRVLSQPEQPDPTSNDPAPGSDPTTLLAGQVVDRDGNPVTPENAAEFVQDVVRPEDIKSDPVQTHNGEARIRHSVTVRLVPDHLRIRAEKFLPLVREMASTFRLDTPLVFAVIHTESYFNPLALSTAPAYGLMQLVPHHGGAEAYTNIHGRSWVPTSEYLYVPRNNIELGCAYMRILQDRYLRSIDDTTSRLYCAISAYNTGPGNVARAFSRSRRVDAAWREVNKLSPVEVLDTLKSRLPYEETRDYLARVLERVALYEEWAD